MNSITRNVFAFKCNNYVQKIEYCRFEDIRKNLIYANICKFVASGIQNLANIDNTFIKIAFKVNQVLAFIKIAFIVNQVLAREFKNLQIIRK